MTRARQRSLRRTDGRTGTAGVTLVEVLVALVLFALIGGAGFAMLDQIIRTQIGTEGRLDRLGALQRGMYLLSTDVSQVQAGTVMLSDEAASVTLSFTRSAPETPAGQVALTYLLDDGILIRQVAAMDGEVIARQPLIDGVEAVVWQAFDPATGWIATWPPQQVVMDVGQTPPNPAAVEAVVSLRDGRQLRRVAAVPAVPQ